MSSKYNHTCQNSTTSGFRAPSWISPDKVSIGTVEKLTPENMGIAFGSLSPGGKEPEIHLGGHLYPQFQHTFLLRDAMLSAVYAVVICLCVSVTLRYCIKTAKCRITQIMPHDISGTLVFWQKSSRRNSHGITPYGSNKYRWGGLKLANFDKKCAITRKRYKIDT